MFHRCLVPMILLFFSTSFPIVAQDEVLREKAFGYQKTSPKSFWGLGIGLFRSHFSDTDGNSALGYEIGLSYDQGSYAIDTHFRGSRKNIKSGSEDYLLFISESIGGRYFFNIPYMSDTSLYVGSGLSVFYGREMTVTFIHHPGWSSSSSVFITLIPDIPAHTKRVEDVEHRFGLGTYFLCGIELGRSHKSRLKLELRLDRPFFKLPNGRDMMPVTLGLSYVYSFDGNGGCLLGF